MRLLLPLGLLGLAGIVALIIIYIIKPNFQQKLISSTYIWKLSLKFKKRKIPLSKLRNILLIACQVLIITTMALILSRMVFILQEKSDQPSALLNVTSVGATGVSYPAYCLIEASGDHPSSFFIFTAT